MKTVAYADTPKHHILLDRELLQRVFHRRVLAKRLHPSPKDNANAWELAPHGSDQWRRARSRQTGFAPRDFPMHLLGMALPQAAADATDLMQAIKPLRTRRLEWT